jgi:hypothetical protein
VLRSDHASNYLVLKGMLGADKARLLAEVRQASERPQQASLRQEWRRGLLQAVVAWNLHCNVIRRFFVTGTGGV